MLLTIEMDGLAGVVADRILRSLRIVFWDRCLRDMEANGLTSYLILAFEGAETLSAILRSIQVFSGTSGRFARVIDVRSGDLLGC